MKDRLLLKKGGGEKGLLVAVTTVAVIGTVFIYSASNYSALKTYGDAYYFVKKQVIGILLGIVSMIFLYTSICFFDGVKRR